MATVDNDTNGVDAARQGLLTRYPLVFFFVFSFVLTWGYFWLIWAPLGLPDPLIALGGFGPAASAFLVLAHHLRQARSASLVAQYCELASWRAMVPGGLAWPSGSKFFGFSRRTRSPRRFCRSDLRLPRVYLSEMAMLSHDWYCPDVGRNWVAWFRANPYTAPIRSCSRNPHPWSAVGRVASALFLWAVGANRTQMPRSSAPLLLWSSSRSA